eukprot:jgi/Chlat1/3958/Chrsp26S04038
MVALLLPVWFAVCVASATAAAAGSNVQVRYASLAADPSRFSASVPARLVATTSADGGASTVCGYAGDQLVWKVPATCTLESSTGVQPAGVAATVRCPAGLSVFQVACYNTSVAAADGLHVLETVSVRFSADIGCYDWFLAAATNTTAGSLALPRLVLPAYSRIRVSAWVLNSNAAAPDELAQTASSPSEFSKTLSLLYYRTGEKPTLGQQILPGKTAPSPLAAEVIVEEPFVMNETLGMWQATLRTTGPGLVPLVVDGNGVTIMACRVAPRLLQASVAAVPDTTSSYTAPIPASCRLRKNPCAPTMAVLVVTDSANTQHTFLSVDAFTSALAGRLLTSESTVFDALPVTDGAVVSYQTGQMSRYDAITALYESTLLGGTPSSVAYSFSMSSTCSHAMGADSTDLPPVRVSSSILSSIVNNTFVPFPLVLQGPPPQPLLAAYAPQQVMTPAAGASMQFYLSADGARQFTSVTCGPLQDKDSGGRLWTLIAMHEVLPLHLQPYLLGLAGVQAGSTNGFALMRCQFDAMSLHTVADSVSPYGTQTLGEPVGRWLLGELWKVDSASSTEHAGLVECSSGEVLAWVGSTLLLSPMLGMSLLPVALKRRASAASPSTDEEIEDVVVSEGGRFAVVMCDGAVLVGRLGVPYAVEVTSGLPEKVPFALDFDVTESLRAIMLTSNGTALDIWELPVGNDVAAAVMNGQLPACPQLQWVDSMPEVMMLDANEQATFNTSLTAAVPLADWANGGPVPDVMLSVAVSHPGYISTHTVQTATFRDTGSMRMVQNNYQVQVGPPESQQSIGWTDIRVSAVHTALACDVVQQTGRVYVGCPPGRYLRVRVRDEDGITPPTQCSSNPDAVLGYTTKDCPASIYQLVPGLLPTLEIWHGDEYVKTADHANFLVWSINGRTDYLFNTTVHQAGCLVPPITIELAQSLGNAANKTSPIRKSSQHTDINWAAVPYYSCFNSSSSVHGKLEQGAYYQILNGSGRNGISFNAHTKNGLFVFAARVLDNSYSHCELEAEFAVRVYGAPMPLWLGILIVLIIVFGVLGMLAVSYVQFSKQKLHMH